MGAETPGISVVVPAYNEARTLPDTLPTFNRAREEFARRLALPCELIIVDNASTDATAEVARSLGARVVPHDVRNIASVRNAGIRAASHSIVITVDADTYLPPEAFVRIWRAMESGHYVGGGTRARVSSARPHVRALAALTEALIVATFRLSVGLYFFRKDAALAIGGFPEAMAIAEDMGFARLLRAHGRKQGLRFCNLRSVTILTLDRKNASTREMMFSLLAGAKVYFGSKPSNEELKYWYQPKR